MDNPRPRMAEEVRRAAVAAALEAAMVAEAGLMVAEEVLEAEVAAALEAELHLMEVEALRTATVITGTATIHMDGEAWITTTPAEVREDQTEGNRL